MSMEKNYYDRLSIVPGMMFLLVFIMQVIMGGTLADPDTGWHLRAGLWILEHGSIPYSDVWSFSAGDTRWYNISWLFDVLLAILYHIGGEGGLYLLTITAYSGVAFLLAQDAMERGASHKVVFLLFPLCILPLLSQSALCRPQIITVVMVYVFIRLLSGDAKTPSWRSLAWLPVLMVLWVNMHGGFLLAPFIFAVFLLEAAVRKDVARIRRLLAIGCVTAAAILVNPYGVYIYEGVARTMSGVLIEYIDEWRKPEIFQHWHLLAVLGCVFGIRIQDRAMPLAEQLLTLLMLVLMLDSGRHGLVFAVVAAPVLSVGLTRTLQETVWDDGFRQRDIEELRNLDSIRAKRWVYGLVAVVLVLLAVAPVRQVVADGDDRFYDEPALRQVLEFIDDQYPDSRWLNQYELGGWLVYYGAPRGAIFIDGRAETAYPEEVTQDYLSFMKAEADGAVMRDLREKYAIDGVMVQVDGNHLELFSKADRWQLVYENDAVALFMYRSQDL